MVTAHLSHIKSDPDVLSFIELLKNIPPDGYGLELNTRCGLPRGRIVGIEKATECDMSRDG